MPHEDEPEHRFGGGEPFTIGVEEELFLVDPVSGRQINSSAAVLERLGHVEGEVARELHACQVELITEVHSSTEAAVRAGVWLRPFRDLIYTMPPYVTGDDDLAAICSGVVAAVTALSLAALSATSAPAAAR